MKCKMKFKRWKANEIIGLLKPFLDPMKNRHPISHFRSDSTYLLKRMRESGHPLVLTLNGAIVAILHDPAMYLEIEERRQQLVMQLDAVQKFPSVGRVPAELSDERVSQLNIAINHRDYLQKILDSHRDRVHGIEKQWKAAKRKVKELSLTLETENT